MYGLLMTLHMLVCLALVGVVLVQSGKGGGLAGGAFGGTATTVFGGRGATDFITRATMVLGAAFFITSIVLSLMTSSLGRSSHSLIQDQARRASGGAAPVLPQQSPTATKPPPGATAPTPGARAIPTRIPVTPPAGGKH